MKLTQEDKTKLKNLRSKMNFPAYQDLAKNYLSMQEIIKTIEEETARGEIPYNLGD